MAFCELVGPSGVRHIDDKLVKIVAVMASGVKDYIKDNDQQLAQVRQNVQLESKAIEAIKKLKRRFKLGLFE